MNRPAACVAVVDVRLLFALSQAYFDDYEAANKVHSALEELRKTLLRLQSNSTCLEDAERGGFAVVDGELLDVMEFGGEPCTDSSDDDEDFRGGKAPEKQVLKKCSK